MLTGALMVLQQTRATMNKLYCGDCLTAMGEHLSHGSAYLIYLDPAFNFHRSY